MLRGYLIDLMFHCNEDCFLKVPVLLLFYRLFFIVCVLLHLYMKSVPYNYYYLELAVS